MIMKETVRSLKVYFYFVAVITGLNSIAGIVMWESGFDGIINIISLVFATAFLYFGRNLQKFLSTSARPILRTLGANMWFTVLLCVLMNIGVFANPEATMDDRSTVVVGTVIGLIFKLLIVWYLLRSVKRLAKEQQAASIV